MIRFTSLLSTLLTAAFLSTAALADCPRPVVKIKGPCPSPCPPPAPCVCNPAPSTVVEVPKIVTVPAPVLVPPRHGHLFLPLSLAFLPSQRGHAAWLERGPLGTGGGHDPSLNLNVSSTRGLGVGLGYETARGVAVSVQALFVGAPDFDASWDALPQESTCSADRHGNINCGGKPVRPSLQTRGGDRKVGLILAINIPLTPVR